MFFFFLSYACVSKLLLLFLNRKSEGRNAMRVKARICATDDGTPYTIPRILDIGRPLSVL